MKPRKVTWFGKVPATCELCSKRIDKVFIDGATSRGWACMCIACHARHGHGLGTGCGQQYEKDENGTWVKVQG